MAAAPVVQKIGGSGVSYGVIDELQHHGDLHHHLLVDADQARASATMPTLWVSAISRRLAVSK
jgi:chemotaxis receptor (MCP) glutamine deamidase CheD